MLAEIRSFLALVWWHICHFLAYNLHVRGLKPASQFFHKVVIIGDDFAAGIGDYITLGSAGGGIAEYLKKIVAYDDKVRHNWAVVNAGVPRSTTADWLMSSPKKYFKNVFTSRATSDASIVIIILGSVEIRNSGTAEHEMKRNLMKICDTLRKKGKQVCLATVASPDPTASEADSESMTLNTALEQFCKSTSTEEAPVILGPRLDTYAFRRESALSYDKYHFNSHSYGQLARNTADFLIPMMTAVEWTTWKEQLGHVTYDKALYD
ncbi:putative GDSL-like Lipase and acylhydrolase domain-containing protein [Phytophthora infestans]|nr:putative GDSL-like Lipase and acylhydrolase domain-containing protein [Phytophthora infestans]